MAGLFAARALRAGRERFDPFGERSSNEDEDEDDDLADVEEAGELNSDDERRATAPAIVQTTRTESNAADAAAAASADAAIDVGDESEPSLGHVGKAPAKPAAPNPLAVLQAAWESTCEMLYEDDDAEVFTVRFSPDDGLLAAGCGDGVVRVFHSDDGRLAYDLQRESDTLRLPLTCLRWRPAREGGTKNILLAASADGTVHHWHVTSRKCLHTIKEEDNQVYALDYQPDGSHFATSGKDYAVRVYDEATKSEVAKLCSGWVGAPSAGHSNRVFSLKFVPDDPQLLLSGGWDNTVQLWDLRIKQPASSMYGPHICGDAIDVSGNEVVTGSWRPSKQLQIWDLRKSEHVLDVPFRPAMMEGSSDPCHLYAAQFSKPTSAGEKLIAAGGSGANELKVFERESLTAVGRMTLPRGVYGIDMSHDGSRIAVAGGDCKVRAMRLPGTDKTTEKDSAIEAS